MKTMKKTVFLIFFVFTTFCYSQKKTNDLASVKSNLFDISLASGISSPYSSFSDNSFASNGYFIELSGAYYFSKIGLGLSLGQISNPTDSNLEDFTNTLGFTTVNTSENWKMTYYGIGPEFKTSFNKFEAKFLIRTGILSVKPITLGSSFNENIDVSIPFYNLKTDKTSQLSYFSTAIKFGYNITENLSLFASADYLSALSDELTITEKTVQDINKNGRIDAEDLVAADGTPLSYTTTSKNVKPQTTNFGFGLSYSFGKKTNKTRSDMSAAGAHTNPYFVSNELAGEMTSANPGGSSGNGNIEGIENVYVGKNKISVALTNPAKEKADREKNKRKLVAVSPKNNSHFKSVDKIENFTWELIGEQIPNPQYIIEIVKVGSNQQPQRTYIGTTTDSKIDAKKVAKFKAGKALADVVKRTDNSGNTNEEQAGDGQYRWKVTETTTGISSNPSYFTMSNCEIDFSISNDTIECLGYEGENLKFKICFDVTYSSTTGNLTYANIGSGLTVFDQTYAALTYTLVSPNPTLVTQIGSSVSTVSYCFEVTVSNSVTQIGFGLQGDDLDPSPILCQPGVSANFDDLPDCLCDDCEDIELSFDNFNISLNAPYGNQFNFNGNINVNVPIYGIEFQVQSYSYTAAPSACSEGVGSVEESGMFLMPGTSINNSTSLQLFNETASGSTSSNNNATKDIKYTSSSPLTGPIPVNLTIGLPGPISGLDPSCCVIDYEVCIKVIIYYEDDSCKSCVFTHCFQFNNQ